MNTLLSATERAYKRTTLNLDEIEANFRQRQQLLEHRPELAPLFEDLDDSYHISPRLDALARGGNARAEYLAWHYLVELS